jgi:hypothetical protein
MRKTGLVPFALVLFGPCFRAGIALADSVYVSDRSRFGIVDLATGSYRQVGPDFPDVSQGLGYTSNGALLTMGFDAYLNSINPSTGVMTRVGLSGLSDCSTPSSPCASNSVNGLVTFNGQAYVTDFQNRLYSVNATTGATRLIGSTGLPAIPFIPLSENPDGTVNVYDEALFEANGKLYATFDAGRIDFATGEVTPVINGALYQIDPVTASSTLIGSTVFGLGAAVEVNGTTYAFLNVTQELANLNLSTGITTAIGPFDAGAGVVSSAVATPEAATIAIAAFGLAVLAGCGSIRRASSCGQAPKDKPSDCATS